MAFGCILDLGPGHQRNEAQRLSLPDLRMHPIHSDSRGSFVGIRPGARTGIFQHALLHGIRPQRRLPAPRRYHRVRGTARKTSEFRTMGALE